jgi:hypothetical protein
MKRFLLVLVPALAAAALVASSSMATDTRGPACVNVVNTDQAYVRDATNDSGQVEVTLILDAPACDDASYSLDIFDFSGRPRLAQGLEPATVSGNFVTFTYSFAAGTAPDQGICFVAETFYKGHLADIAPDSGCFQVAEGGGSGGGQGAT